MSSNSDDVQIDNVIPIEDYQGFRDISLMNNGYLQVDPPILQKDIGVFDVGSEYLDEEFFGILDRFLKERMNFKSMRYESKGLFNPMRKVDTGMRELERLQDDHGHLESPSNPESTNVNMYTFNKHPHQMFEVCIKLNDKWRQSVKYDWSKYMNMIPKRFHYLPPGGAYGWHDNVEDSKVISGKDKKVRLLDIIYLIHVEETHKTLFKFLRGDEIYEMTLKKGWSAFKVSPFTWNCIESNTNTIMMAFRASEKDHIGFNDANHFLAEKHTDRNFTCTKTDVEEVNRINAICHALQLDTNTLRDFRSSFFPTGYWSVPLRFFDHLRNKQRVDLKNVSWKDKDKVKEDAEFIEDDVKTIHEYIKQKTSTGLEITVLSIPSSDKLVCIQGVHILNDIHAKCKAVERFHMERYEKSLETADENNEQKYEQFNEDCTFAVDVRILVDKDFTCIEQQRVSKLEPGYHDVASEHLMMNIPLKSVTHETPLDPDPNNPGELIHDIRKKSIDRPVIVPMPILSHFTEKGGDLTEDIKLQLIDFVMQIFFINLGDRLQEPINKILLNNVDVRVKMLQSDKNTLIQDDVNNKNLYKVIANLHEKAQFVQFNNLESFMENQSVRLEQGESCSYWPTPVKENYCIDNFHDRRYIGKGSMLDITLYIKDCSTLTTRGLVDAVSDHMKRLQRTARDESLANGPESGQKNAEIDIKGACLTITEEDEKEGAGEEADEVTNLKVTNLMNYDLLTQEESELIAKTIIATEGDVKKLGDDRYGGTSEDSLTGRYYCYNYLNNEIIGPIIKPKLKKIVGPCIVQCWANIFRKGEGIGEHEHLDKRENDPAQFASANIFIQGDKSIGTHYQGLHHESKVGQLSIFPPDMRHHVSENTTDEIRVSIAMDLWEKTEKMQNIKQNIMQMQPKPLHLVEI